MIHRIFLPQLLLVAFMLFVNHSLQSQTLKSIAESKGKFIGNVVSDGLFNNNLTNNGATDLILKTEFNCVVAGNRMKMFNLLKNRPVNPFNVQISDINTNDIDKFVAYADANGMRKRGHVMIWYSQAPNWLITEAPSWTAQQVYDFSRSYIIALSTYTAGKIDEWDVLNEALLDNGYRTGTWYDIVNTQANSAGKTGYLEYFASVFKWARQGDPNVPLFYNDYSIEAFGTSKNNRLRTMVKSLKNDYNAPINGVGLQSHFTLDEMTPTFITNVGKTMDDLGTAGFTTNITELDIRMCTGDNKTTEDHRVAYREIVKTAFSKNNCNTVLIWGVSDNDSWIPSTFTSCGQATLYDANSQKKLAYSSVKDALTAVVNIEGIKVISGPVSVSVGTNATVYVDYKATQSRDVVVMFQLDTSPNTTYQSVKTTVAAGIGTISIPILIPGTVPIANAAYQYQVFMAPVGDNWNNKINNVAQSNVTTVTAAVTAPSSVSALTASNVGSSTLNLSWTAATDNVGVKEYRVFVNGVLHGSTTNITYLITGLSSSVSYTMSVVGVDNAGNQSTPTAINVTTILPITSAVTSVSGPNSVVVSSAFTVAVSYEASESREVHLIFQQDTTPFAIYKTVKTTVGAGNGTLLVSVLIPANVPIVAGGYQHSAYITTIGGTFATRIGNSIAQKDVNVRTPPIVSKGTGGGSWLATSTWFNGVVPTQNDDVTIVAADAVSLSGNGICKSLTISAGSLTVTSGSLTVNTLVNNGTLTIENNVNLIQTATVNTNSGAGNTIVKRNSNPLFRSDYTLWTSPVTGTQTFSAFSPLTPIASNSFYEYNETTNLYSGISISETFIAAKGYLIRMPNTNPLSGYDSGATNLVFPGVFTGVLNNGYVPVTLEKESNGYTAVGNPYPSVLDAETFITANTANIESTLYFWRKANLATTSAYATYTAAGSTTATPTSAAPNGKIQVGQGFFVKAKKASTIANFFTNAMRDIAPTSTQFFKTKQVVEKDRIWLNLTNTSGAFSQALIAYIADATAGVDSYDGKYFNDSPIALTSKINNEEFTIQGRPKFDETDEVALNFKTDVAGNYTIAIDHIDGLFSAGQNIYLTDSKTGTETDLKAGPYTFNATAGIDNTRFSLKYQKTLSVALQVFTENNVTIYQEKGVLHVNSKVIGIKTIELYDLQGRLITQQKDVKATTAVINNLTEKHQFLIVKVIGENGELVVKKVLN